MELEEYYAKKAIELFKKRIALFNRRKTTRDCFKLIFWILEDYEDEVRRLSDETFEKNVFEGFLDYEEYWAFNEECYKTDLAKVLGKTIEISIKNKEPLSMEEVIRISKSKSQVWGNFLYQCLIYYSKKRNIDLEKKNFEINKIC